MCQNKCLNRNDLVQAIDFLSFELMRCAEEKPPTVGYTVGVLSTAGSAICVRLNEIVKDLILNDRHVFRIELTCKLPAEIPVSNHEFVTTVKVELTSADFGSDHTTGFVEKLNAALRQELKHVYLAEVLEKIIISRTRFRFFG